LLNLHHQAEVSDLARQEMVQNAGYVPSFLEKKSNDGEGKDQASGQVNVEVIYNVCTFNIVYVYNSITNTTPGLNLGLTDLGLSHSTS